MSINRWEIFAHSRHSPTGKNVSVYPVIYARNPEEFPMQITSVNLGQPREIETPRGIILTSIFKSPVTGRIPVRGHNLVGDRQADLSVHGGPNKAIYAYASEHHPYWQSLLNREIVPGHFGENLTTAGLLESEAQIADHYRIGSAILKVTQPRMPCAKLNLRFNLHTMVKRFWQSGLSGIYFGVVEEGDIAAGDPIELVHREPASVTIAEVVQAYKDPADESLVDRVLASPINAGSWRKDILEYRESAAPGQQA
jgi:MOSC domain-containing protein YiiM